MTIVTSPLENLCGPDQALSKEAPDANEFGLGPEVWRVLARCHDLRNRGEYEGDQSVDERLLADLIHACKIVAAALSKLPAV